MNLQHEAAAKEFLHVSKWPGGLIEECIKGARQTAVTYFIVDDSGSMSTSDSCRFIKNGNLLVKSNCTRWAELLDTITFHASLANSMKEPVVFRLLNNSAPITIGGPSDDGSGYNRLMQAMQLPPSGGTPLCAHINAIVAEISAMSPRLRADAKKVKLIICTDGEASDGDVAIAMRPLKELPVHVVLRLCTNDNKIVSYWDKVETDLELSMDVVDDMASEADAVTRVNPWLLYSEPLQRLRESGCTVSELDKLDEVKLNADQIKNVCQLIFGEKYKSSLPHPDADWKGFMTTVKNADEAEQHSYSPVTKSISYHIDKKMLAKHLGKKECVIM